MSGWNSFARYAGVSLTILLIVGASAAVILLAGRPRPSSPLPEAPRASSPPEAGPTGAEVAAAIRNEDVSAVRKLLDRGADVNARDAEGNTPLILASFYAGPECVQLLIETGADVNAANRAGVTPLIRAATNYEKTHVLVTAGAQVRVRTALGNTPLILAARRAGNARTVQFLLDRGADATERNEAGVSPILAGAASGDVETVRLLLDAGARVDDFPNSNPPAAVDFVAGMRTPLMWAASRNDTLMIRLLLDHRADPDRSTFFGNPLSHACWHDNFEAAELLLARGAKVSARDAVANFTPLHWAAGTESPRPELIKMLLAHGADPNATGGEHVSALGLVPQTPRLIAEKRGRTAIVDALVAAGAEDPPAGGGRGEPAGGSPKKTVTPHRTLPQVLDDALLIASTEKALSALQTSAARSRESFVRHASKQDCASCHQQYLPMAAIGHVRSRSVRFDREAAQEQIDSLGKLTNPFSEHERTTQTLFHPDPAHSHGYHLFGLAAEGGPPSPKTDGMVHHLVTVQAADGRWFHQVPRPPMNSCDVTATALAVHAITRYGWPGRGKEFVASVERARRWLWTVRPETTEEAVFQLLGLRWAGEPAEKLVGLAKPLLQRQRPDGGWAQLPMLDSDAYATGEVLYALAQAVKAPATDPAWQRGLRFLLERQEDDGTWHVARRTFPFQPTMDSGFPHQRDSWISAAATSWAVLALTWSLPGGPAPGKPVAGPTTPEPPPMHQEKVDFARQIKPVLERSCAGCHSGEKARGLFRLDSREAVLRGGASGVPAVVPGQGLKSPLIDHVSGQKPDMEMPPGAVRGRFPGLTTDEVALLRAWVDQGADWPTGEVLGPPRKP
jgi:ankyrin repeat protein